MRKDGILTEEQRCLVADHMAVVHWVIVSGIHVNERIYGFSYDDLFQEGCVWLCRAAVSYDASLSQFSTYARKVVRNGLLSYCRGMCDKQRHFTRLELGEHGELVADGAAIDHVDESSAHISMLETLLLLESRKQDYSGIARLGIEALELKIKGSSIKEIAQMYDVPSSYVGAWISRSAKKLRKDRIFLDSIR